MTSAARTRHRLALPAAAVAIVILSAALTLAVMARPSPSPAASGRSAPSASSAGMTASQAQSQLPQVSLQGLRWSEFYGIELPFSVQAGPHDTSGGLAAGFAHSPLGALLAAVNIGVRANAQWGPAIFGPEIRGHVTGPGSEGTTVRASTRLQVHWDRTDWVLVAPPGGSWPNSASVLSSLAGYTVFPGQG